MATMEDIRTRLEAGNAAVAAAQKLVADAREDLRAEVTLRTEVVKSAQDVVEAAVNSALAGGKVSTANRTVYDTYGKGAYLNILVGLENGKVEYKWPSLTILAAGAGVPRTPRAGGGTKSTYHYEHLDLSLPKIVKPDGIGYDAWLGQGLTDSFNAIASEEQKAEVAGISPMLVAGGKSPAAIGSAVYKYRCDLVHQAVAAGRLTPVR